MKLRAIRLVSAAALVGLCTACAGSGPERGATDVSETERSEDDNSNSSGDSAQAETLGEPPQQGGGPMASVPEQSEEPASQAVNERGARAGEATLVVAMQAEQPVDSPAVDPTVDPAVAPTVDPTQEENCAASGANAGPVGYGEETTGGGDASPVVVSSFEEAVSVLAAYRSAFKEGTQNSLVVHYSGSFDFSSIDDVCEQHEKEAKIVQIKEVENVTFEGLAGSSANFGLHINRARNVIVRNMTIGLLPGGGSSDALTIEGNGTNGDVENVWIDHNELFSSTKSDCPGAGDTEFDGLIDIKKGARRITVSFNHLHDHQKTGLLGHSDSDDMERYVTFHHNWYEDVVSRTPLHRFGYVHLFNNYYNRISSSGINVRMGGVALIEANSFENAVNPITSRYSDEPGFWDLRDNLVGEGIVWTVDSDTLANADDWQSTIQFPDDEIDYDYQVDPAGCVKQLVVASAGATLAL